MWRVLTQLPTLLAEIVRLLQEQNLLTRELIRATTGREATTPPSPGSVSLPPRQPPRPSRKLQATDIQVFTRADRLTQQARERDRKDRPWSSGEWEPSDPAEPEPDETPT